MRQALEFVVFALTSSMRSDILLDVLSGKVLIMPNNFETTPYLEKCPKEIEIASELKGPS